MLLRISFLFGFVSCEFVQTYINLDFILERKIPIDMSERIAVETDNLIGCVAECLLNSICDSYFYHMNSSSCQLYSKRFTVDEVTDVGGTGWKYSILYRGTGCPLKNGYMYEHSLDICYIIYPKPMVTTASLFKANCTSQGAELIRIDSQDKQDYFAGVFGQITEYFLYAIVQGNYVGAGTWQFDDGTPFTYFSWNINQPDDLPSQPFIGMKKGSNYLWHDLPDSYPGSGVFGCEIRP